MQIQYTDKGWIYKGEWQLIVVYENVVYNQGQVMWFACFCMLSAVSLQALVPPWHPSKAICWFAKWACQDVSCTSAPVFSGVCKEVTCLTNIMCYSFIFTQCCETDWTEFSQFSKHARTHTHTPLLELLWQNASDSPSCWRQPCWDTSINIWTSNRETWNTP